VQITGSNNQALGIATGEQQRHSGCRRACRSQPARHGIRIAARRAGLTGEGELATLPDTAGTQAGIASSDGQSVQAVGPAGSAGAVSGPEGAERGPL
jgi:hypothetical protein